MTRPVLLDLFCCQGGAAVGYHRAGFDVVGVDINPQPRYPFDFVQADAAHFLAHEWERFAAVHASPPCRDHSALAGRHGPEGSGFLLPALRYMLQRLPLPYVIENVERAAMPGAVTLCGSMFDLGSLCRDDTYRQLRRHRKFEASFALAAPRPCAHAGQAVGVYGHGGTSAKQKGYAGSKAEAVEALGIDWMTMAGLSQSIPPAYTEWIGAQLLRSLAYPTTQGDTVSVKQ